MSDLMKQITEIAYRGILPDDVVNKMVKDRYVSNCCGAYPLSNGDVDTMEYGICPDCGEHCDYITESEAENEIL